MRKFQKAAVVAAILGSIGFVGAGTASAHGGVDIDQTTSCKSHDLNIALLNNIGIANGLLGNAAGGEGNPGAQAFNQGSTNTCTNAVSG
jgi:hypothetical protein